MKKLTPFSVLFLLFFFASIFNTAKAHPGDSCSNPYTIYMDSAFVKMPLTDSITWVKFTATRNFSDIVLIDPSDTLNGRITLVTLNSGTCTTTDSLGSASYIPGQDSVISLLDAHITSGTTYLVKLTKPIRGINDASRFFYMAVFLTPIPPLSQMSPRGVHNVQHNLTNNCVSNPCDLVSNGNFETANLTCSQLTSESFPGILTEYDYRATDGYSDVSCWWSTDIGSHYFNSCYPMSCGSGNSVPKNWGGCNVQDHSIAEGWPGPSYGYCGISVDYLGGNPNEYLREYLLQKLSNPMAAGATYKVSFWVQLDSLSDGHINAGDMGMFISVHEPYWFNNSYAQLDSGTGHVAVAQITGAPTALCPTCGCSPSAFNTARTWVNISGLYTATGNEKFIEIGNFRKDSTHTTTGSHLPQDQADYFVDDVSIVPYLTATASPSIICSIYPSTQLTASGGFTSYTWMPGALSGQTVTVNPPGTTTYTVIASYGGSCRTDTATVTITVDPPFSVIILGGGGNICSGTPVYALPSGGTSPYTYSWAPSGETTDTLYSLSAGTYTLTTTDAIGCSATTSTSFTVNPHCCYLGPTCSNPVSISSGQSSSSYSEADFTSNSCISISGPGAFTISGSFTITGCDIAMGDSASIVVPSGATLTIDTSRLYACGDMWKGIIVAGTLYINGTSSRPCIVEDAIKGIDLEGNATIHYGLLNNNLYDIYAHGTNFAAPGLTLLSSKLTCQSDPGYSSNAYLKPPYLGYITNSGVYINNVSVVFGSLTIGNYSSPSYRDTFSNMNYGVNAHNSSFYVYNNLFENLAGNTQLCMAVFPSNYTYCPPPIGIAILANDTNGTEYIGSNWYYAKTIIGENTIQECYRGVDLTGYSFPIITNNKFYNTADAYSTPYIGAYPYGDHAIYLKTVSGPQILNDTITNFSTGIHLNDVGLAGVPNHPGNIAYNQILATGSSSGLVSSGILVENLLTPAPAFLDSGLSWMPLQINNNSVANASSSCIELNNANPIYPLVGIDSNSLQILPSTTATDRTQRSGIYLKGSQNFVVYDNAIGAPGTYTSNSPSGRADTSVIGIRGILSTNAVYDCNSINHAGECMMFEGYNYPSTVHYNTMENAYNGFVLESSGVIGKQGNGTNPIGDVWQGPFSNYDTYTLNSDATSSPLYVRNNSLENPSNNGGAYGTPYGSPGTIYIATGTVPTCPSGCTNCRVIHGPEYRSFAQMVVDDSIPYSVFIGESKYIGQQAVFTEISEDTTLMDSSAILHNFYNTISGTTPPNNIGALYTISADIAAKDYTAAQSLNNSITPINLIEQNQQLVNYVYLQTLGRGIDTATKPQYDTLVGVAVQCPLEGGNAVFQSRALLNILMNTNFIITDSCLNDSSSGRFGLRRPANPKSTITSNINAKVYPNPANTMLNIEVSLTQGQIAYFEMYNSLGEEIQNMELNSALTTLPTNNLPGGMYYYRITDKNRNTLKADKQLILH